MDVLRARKIRQKQQNRTQRPPPKEVIENRERCGSDREEHRRKKRSHRLEGIGSFLGELRRFEKQSAAHVKENKRRDEGRDPEDSGSHFRQHRHIFRKAEILRPDQAPSKDHADHSDEHARGQ